MEGGGYEERIRRLCENLSDTAPEELSSLALMVGQSPEGTPEELCERLSSYFERSYRSLTTTKRTVADLEDTATLLHYSFKKPRQEFSLLEALPQDLLLEVLGFLPMEDVAQARAVSKRYRAAVTGHYAARLRQLFVKYPQFKDMSSVQIINQLLGNIGAVNQIGIEEEREQELAPLREVLADVSYAVEPQVFVDVLAGRLAPLAELLFIQSPGYLAEEEVEALLYKIVPALEDVSAVVSMLSMLKSYQNLTTLFCTPTDAFLRCFPITISQSVVLRHVRRQKGEWCYAEPVPLTLLAWANLQEKIGSIHARILQHNALQEFALTEGITCTTLNSKVAVQ